MTEVVETMKRYLFMERQADTLIISVFPINDASRRVAIKNGFIFKSLERKCGITGCGEIADIEIYILEKEKYLNLKAQKQKIANRQNEKLKLTFGKKKRNADSEEHKNSAINNQ